MFTTYIKYDLKYNLTRKVKFMREKLYVNQYNTIYRVKKLSINKNHHGQIFQVKF